MHGYFHLGSSIFEFIVQDYNVYQDKWNAFNLPLKCAINKMVYEISTVEK